MKKCLYFILVLLITACASISTDYRYDKTEKGKLYFPTFDETKYKIDTIETGPNDSLRSFSNKWYSKHLYSLKEPVLINNSKEKNIIRFTHLGTWSNPYSYRIEQVYGKFFSIYKRTNGLGGYETGSLIKDKTREVSSKKWNEILEKIQQINIWNIPTHETRMYNDGEEWILEILIDGKYHLIVRTSPDSNEKEFAELCKLIEKASK